MGDSFGMREHADVPLGERTSSELVELVKKLRWIAMEEEAERIQIMLRRIDSTATLFAGPWDTD
jgi:hypothetical protein